MNWSLHPVDCYDGGGQALAKTNQVEPRLWARVGGQKAKGKEKENKGICDGQGERTLGLEQRNSLNPATYCLLPRLSFQA